MFRYRSATCRKVGLSRDIVSKNNRVSNARSVKRSLSYKIGASNVANETPFKHIQQQQCTLKTQLTELPSMNNTVATRLYSEKVGNVMTMPALSPTMEKGNLTKWRKNVGDHLQEGDVLCEIETDKATLEFENPEEGYLGAILVDAGSMDVPLGKPIAVIVDTKDEVEKVNASDYLENESSTSTAAPQNEKQQQKKQPEAAASSSARQTSGVLSPAVRSLVDNNNLDPALIPATGPKSRLLKGDVLKVLKSGNLSNYQRTTPPPKKAEPKSQKASSPQSHKNPISTKPSPSAVSTDGGEFEDLPLSQMRKVIAQRLLESKQTLPHAYQTIETRVDSVLSFRQKLKDMGVKVSVNDLIIKAAALALRDVPECNVINGKQAESVDVSVAVATDRGLITPIVKNVNTLGLSQISAKVKELAGKARDNKLKPEEFQGGSFSVSNLGMFGISEFKAVINPPQGLILAIGGTEQKLVVNNDPLGRVFESEEQYEEALDRLIPKDTVPKVGNFMSASASLSNIHVDPADVSRFLAKFKNYLENPEAMLL